MSRFGEAVRALRERGHTVEASDMIGLTLVDGFEMTMGQVEHVAWFGMLGEAKTPAMVEVDAWLA